MKLINLILPLAVFANTFYQGLGKGITTIFGLIITIILTRYLGVLGFGELNLIFAYVSIAATISDFGLTALLTRFETEGRATSEFISKIFGLRIIISLIILTAFNLLSLSIYSQNIVLGILIYSVGNLFLISSNIFYSIFQARLRMGKYIFAQVVGSFITLAATIIFVSYQLPFSFIIFAQTLGLVTCFFINLAMFDKKMTLNFDFQFFREILKNAWPFFIISIFTILYWKIDLIILSFYKNPTFLPDVGIYSTAFKILEVMIIFGGFFGQALFPVFIKENKSSLSARILGESLSIAGILGVFSVTFILLFAGFIIYIVAGDGFGKAVLPLKILSLAFPISLLVNIFYNKILILEKQKEILPIGFFALIFNIVTNIIFIPIFSYIASSVITVLTILIILIGYIMVVVKSSRI